MKINVDNVFPRLAPARREEEYIKNEIVYRRLADLLLSYYKPVEEIALIPITKDLMTGSDLTEDDLYERAECLLDDEVTLTSMSLVFAEFGQSATDKLESEPYILTNESGCLGAGVVVCRKARQKIEEVFGSVENVILLPSSVHEFILVEKGVGEMTDLINTVREVNRNFLSDEDFLSDNIYRLSPSGGLIVLNDVEGILDLI